MPSPTATLTEPQLEAWRGMLRVHHELIAKLDAELEREHGLPLVSYEVLLNLAETEGDRLRMSELADRLLLSRSGLTRLVDRLEREGLVARSRCRDDARGLWAKLTPRGRARFEAARPDHLAGVRDHFLSRLEPAEIEALGDTWRRMLAPSGKAP